MAPTTPSSVDQRSPNSWQCRTTRIWCSTVPHYSYLVLKMPTEHDVLTLRGNVYTAYTCEEESFKVAEATDISIRTE
jgi:hypothetical protein